MLSNAYRRSPCASAEGLTLDLEGSCAKRAAWAHTKRARANTYRAREHLNRVERTPTAYERSPADSLAVGRSTADHVVLSATCAADASAIVAPPVRAYELNEQFRAEEVIRTGLGSRAAWRLRTSCGCLRWDWEVLVSQEQNEAASQSI